MRKFQEIKKPKKRKESIFLSNYIIYLVVVIAIAVYYYRNDIKLAIQPIRFMEHDTSIVPCNIISNIGNENFINLDLSFPIEDKRQKVDILKNMPRIKHELLTSFDNPEMILLIKHRNFPELRKNLTQIVNKYVEKPIKEVYFEGFFID